MMTPLLLLALAASIETNPMRQDMPQDSSTTVDIDEVVVIASPKQTNQLRKTATSVSLFSSQDMKSGRIGNLSGLNGLAPSFFVPNYGSRLSSAAYIRGIGSRAGTPAVGLYVDDVPVIDRSEYSLNLLGIDRIDVLRGPQSTLYGVGAMGGIVRMYSRNPFNYQGTDIQVSGATRNEALKLHAMTNQRFSDKLAMSLGGYYETDNGFWRNDSLGRKVGGTDAFGLKLRTMYHPSDRWLLDMGVGYQYSDESGYPYFYGGSIGGGNLDGVGRITANRESSYRRSLLTGSLKAQWTGENFVLSSVTGYQGLRDRMMMDQDFTYLDDYTLEQRQRAHTLSEDLSLRSLPGRRWEWTGGVSTIWENLRTKGPVTFYQDGVDMINTSIASHMPTPSITITNPRTGGQVTQALPMSLAITDESFGVPSAFRTPVLNLAAYWQGTLHDFLVPRLGLTLGLRLDYAHQELNYRGGAPVGYRFAMPSFQLTSDMTTSTSLSGKTGRDYTTLLPKAALQYDLPEDRGNVYVTVSKGQRAGGYNIQMFSDILSKALQNDMMQGTKDYVDGVLTELANSRPQLSTMFTAIREAVDQHIPIGTLPDVKATVIYKPETSWNYELGTHLNLIGKTLTLDAALYFMDIRNQQISRFVSSGLGRIMVNAGRSHSCGIETGLASHLLNDRLFLRAAYSFTHSEFRRYNTGDADYKGNRVPFIPEHTASVLADYTWRMNAGLLHSLTLGAQATGLGNIYWNEENSARQPFYVTLGAHLTADMGKISVNLWGQNLTNTGYKSFYFESVQRKFYQKGTPFQLGIDVNLHF